MTRRRRVVLVPFVCGMLGVTGCARTAPAPASPSIAIPKSVSRPAAAGAPCEPPRVAAIVPTQSPRPRDSEATGSLRLAPESMTLEAGDPGFQAVVQEVGKDGGRIDRTAEATWRVDPPGVVSIEPDGYLRPRSAGRAEVLAIVGDRSAALAVKVASISPRRWDFAEDVVPVLTRSGCNTGGCHGKADGQNGFHLSLFGYDPEGDYRGLTRDAGGRRVSRLEPGSSLILRKATGRVAHGGGPRFGARSPEALTIRAWIEAGAPYRQEKAHGPLVRIAVSPEEVRLDAPGPQQLRVEATYADGHRRDVTRLASFRIHDDSVVAIDSNAKAVLLRRAETDLIVRYQSQVVSTRVAAVINPGLEYDFAGRRRRNFIDEELFKRLASLKVPPSPPASDAAFLRRASLDLTGRQPTPPQVRQYLDDKDPEKRVKLVDRLLADRDFVGFWRIKFGDLLQISRNRQGNGAPRFQAWIDDCLRENTPWDEMVRAMLTAVGTPDEFGHGPVNYALDGPDAKTRAEQTAQRFLGLRLRCAQCHDHPFDVWTQDDYFGLAACFARVERVGDGGMMGKAVVKVDPRGQVEHLRTRRPAAPRLLDGRPVVVAERDDPRKALAAWMTAPGNPFFARAMANWAWAQFFGKGLADPADDLGRSNPPVHPELLEALARHFEAHKYDLRDLVRTIAVSEAYGLSSGTVPGNEHDTRLFSHQSPRPLGAHQMADALAQATDVINRYPNRAAGTRAIEVTDPAAASTILDTFGRCPRANGCATVSTPPLSLRQSLLLIGGDAIEGKVAHPNGYLANLLELGPEPEEVVENLYFRTLCRPPSEEERSHWSAELKQAGSLREAAEDLFWALLNSREFAFNH